jgi:hypothetical protein
MQHKTTTNTQQQRNNLNKLSRLKDKQKIRFHYPEDKQEIRLP